MRSKGLIITSLTIAICSVITVGFSAFIFSANTEIDKGNVDIHNINVGSIVSADSPLKDYFIVNKAQLSLTENTSQSLLTFSSGKYQTKRAYETWRDTVADYSTGATNKDYFSGSFVFTWEITNIPASLINSLDIDSCAIYLDSSWTIGNGSLSTSYEALLSSNIIESSKTDNNVTIKAELPLFSKKGGNEISSPNFFDYLYVIAAPSLPSFNVCLDINFNHTASFTDSNMLVHFSWEVNKI